MSSAGFGAMYDDGGFFALAATVLCCYEHMITFSDEVRCIWRRRISAASLLFLVNRYSILAVSLASIVQVLPWSLIDFDARSRDQICAASLRLTDACIIAINVVYAVFAALRMLALYNMKKTVFLLVLFVGLLNPCAQILLMSIETTGPIGSNGPIGNTYPLGRLNCDHSISSTAESRFSFNNSLQAMTIFFPVLRFHSLVFEGILIGLTWKKTVNRWSLQRPVARTPFTTMLLRDGTLYFVVIGLASTMNVIGMFKVTLWHANVWNLEGMGIVALAMSGPLVDALTSICMSRFIINLLAITLDECTVRSSQKGATRTGTIVWRIADGLGGDLHGSFLEEGASEELEEGEGPDGVEGDDQIYFGDARS